MEHVAVKKRIKLALTRLTSSRSSTVEPRSATIRRYCEPNNQQNPPMSRRSCRTDRILSPAASAARYLFENSMMGEHNRISR
jgi:hypothetical protein